MEFHIVFDGHNLAGQLYNQLHNAIESGQLAAETQLPPGRLLACSTVWHFPQNHF